MGKSIFVVLNPTRASDIEDLVVPLPIEALKDTAIIKRNLAEVQTIDQVFLNEELAHNRAVELMNGSVGDSLGIKIPKNWAANDDDTDAQVALRVILDGMNQMVDSFFRFHIGSEPLHFLQACENNWKQIIKEQPSLAKISIQGEWIKCFVHTMNNFKDQYSKERVQISPQWLYGLIGKHIFQNTFYDGKRSLAEFCELMLLRQQTLAITQCFDQILMDEVPSEIKTPHLQTPVHGMHEDGFSDFVAELCDIGKYEAFYDHIRLIDRRLEERFNLLEDVEKRLS